MLLLLWELVVTEPEELGVSTEGNVSHSKHIQRMQILLREAQNWPLVRRLVQSEDIHVSVLLISSLGQ
jgi:hypothetical protein